MENDKLVYAVELRAADDSPGILSGLILPIGRIAADRKEVFTPNSATFPSGGVRLLLEHEGREVMTFEPVAVSEGYRIEATLPTDLLGIEAAELVKSGERSNLSVEFQTIEEERVSDVREVRRALISAAALVGFGCLLTSASRAPRPRASLVVLMALTATEARDAAEALVDDYCVTGAPAEIRTAAIAKLAEHLRSYPSDGLTNTQYGDQGASWKPSSRSHVR